MLTLGNVRGLDEGLAPTMTGNFLTGSAIGAINSGKLAGLARFASLRSLISFCCKFAICACKNYEI
jgi:hypothetical protein